MSAADVLALAELAAACDDVGVRPADLVTRARELRSTVAALAMLADGHANRAAARSWRQVAPDTLPPFGARVLLLPCSLDGRTVDPQEYAIFGRRTLSMTDHTQAWGTVAGRFPIHQMSHFLEIPTP